MSTARTRRVIALTAALLLFVGMLGFATATSGTASAAPDRLAEPVATTTTVVMTAPEPMTVHVEVTVTAADGSTPSGMLNVVEGGGSWPTQQVTGTVTVFDQPVDKAGPHEFRIVFYPDDRAAYAHSEGSGTATVAPRPTSLVLTAEDLGRGVVQLIAVVGGAADGGQVVFEVEGRDPVAVKPGERVYLDRRGQTHGNYAILDLGGLPMGTHDVTATYVPEDANIGSSSAQTTASLTRSKHPTRTYLYLDSLKRGEVRIRTQFGTQYPQNAVGTVVIKDAATKKTVWVFRSLSNWKIGVRILKVTPGKHRYRAIFTPAQSLRTTVSGSYDHGRVTVKR